MMEFYETEAVKREGKEGDEGVIYLSLKIGIPDW